MRKIETYILTGFLGAGKTTILNKILQYFPEKNGIIENEFGKVNIDTGLIDQKYEELYELTGGCICCSLDGNLIETIEKILKSTTKIDRLFIETTGIADPGSIASVFKTIPVSNHFQIKKIIGVVDCEQILDHLKIVNEITRQIISTDLIILNKCSNQPLQQIELEIQKINPFAHIVNTNEELFKLEWFDLPEIKKEAFFRPLNKPKNNHLINAIFYESSSNFHIETLRIQLQFILNLYYQQIFRIKGFVKNENNQFYLIQSTGKTIYIKPSDNQHTKSTQLVFIGLDLEEKSVKRILEPTIHKKKRKTYNNVAFD